LRSPTNGLPDEGDSSSPGSRAPRGTPAEAPGRRLVLGLVLAVVVAVSCLLVRAGYAALVARARQEIAAGFEVAASDYAGSEACRACHPDHERTWRATYHRTMTTDLGPDAAGRGPRPHEARAPFDGQPYRYGPVAARPWRDEAGRYFMTFTHEGGRPRAEPRTFEVTRAVGSHRYQQYFTKVGDAWLRLPLAYHLQEKRWLHMNGAFLTPDPPPLAVEPMATDDGGAADAASVTSAPPFARASPVRFGGPFAAYDRHVTRWNDNCIFCHNVAANPAWDARAATFASTTAELGVACESCHGPGAAHVAANRSLFRRYALHGAGAGDPTIVNPARLSPGRAADVCGHCHGQRITDDVGRFLSAGDPFVPGQDLGLYSSPLWSSTSLHGEKDVFARRFWDDGTPRLTAYEYQGWLLSRCAQVGALTCTSCHGMHDGAPAGQLRPVARGDGACRGCHAAEAASELATAKLGNAASGTSRVAPSNLPRAATHSRHPASVACVDCHMPRIVYGVMDVLRSHRIERPDLARTAGGRPDACRLCHVSRDRAWLQRGWQELWGARSLDLRARDAAPARAGGDAAPASVETAVFASPLLAWAIGGDPVVRAVAVDALGRLDDGDAGSRDARLAVLEEVMRGDPYPAVRRIAARGAAALAPDAARALTAFDPTGPPPARLAALRRWGAVARGGATWPPVATVVGEPSRLRRAANMQALDIGE